MSKCDKNTQMKKPTISKYDSDSWIVYKDSIPPPLKHPKTCTDTINSMCSSGKSVDECILECDESEKCSFGYHLKYGDNTTKCLPIYTSDYYPTSNPTYSIKNQQCYDIPTDITSHSFISKKRWGSHGILPNEANAVFFDDTVLLGNRLKNTKSFLKNGSGGKISFKEFGGTKLKLLSEYGSGLKTIVEYGDVFSLNMVKNDDGFTSDVMIAVPDTFSKNYDNYDSVVFKPYKNTFLSKEQKFTIIPVPGNTDKQFSYNSNFLLRADTGFLQIRITKNISTLVINTTINPLHNYPHYDNKNFDISSTIFNFRPTKYIYTCQSGKCTEHKLIDAKKHERMATVNGNTAYTRSDCFGSCNWSPGNNYQAINSVHVSQSVKTPVDNCDNKWCITLTIILIILIIMAILILR